MRRVGLAVALIGLVVVAAGCRHKSGPQRVAEAFLDAYYVHIDLGRARELCSGLARAKIEREIGLTHNVPIDRETRTPQVGYRLRQERSEGDARRFVYELSIRAPDSEPFKRTVIITVRGEPGRWSVANYSES
ncbi:MAG: hypothetical protein D6760_08670 [Deltaproteobacteria bacterium]|nr:MAG: hypothetical protein D6760_08670 [Deltaproteobacteria bacterium]